MRGRQQIMLCLMQTDLIRYSCSLNYALFQFLSFQNFRESYCRYDMDLLDNLEGIHNSSICQEACRYRKKCNFFQYFEDDKICKLQNTHSDLRECDIIHGTPTPTLESCNYQKKIKWASGTCCLTMIPR